MKDYSHLLIISTIFAASVLEGSFVNIFTLGTISIAIEGTVAKFLSLMENTKILRIWVKSHEVSALVIWLNAFHLNNFSSREDIGKLDWAPAFFLIFNDLKNSLFNWISLCYCLIVVISLICVLVALYIDSKM